MLRRTVGVAAVGAVAAALWAQRGQWHAAVTAAAPDWPWLVGAVALLAGTYVTAAAALCLLTPLALPLGRTTLVQLVGAVANRVVPSGLGAAAVNVRYLTRRALPLRRAVTVLGTVGVGHAVAWAAAVAVVLPWAGAAARFPPLPAWAVAAAGAAAAAGVVAAVLARRSARVRAAVAPVRAQLAELAGHPGRVAGAFAALVAGKLAHGFALATVLHAFGSPLPAPLVVLAYLGGSAAANSAPTPAGIGATEVALVAALHVAGGGPAVPAAVLLYRAMVWLLPLVPGGCAWWLLRRCRGGRGAPAPPYRAAPAPSSA